MVFSVYCVRKETERDVCFSKEHFFIADSFNLKFLLLISWNSPIKFTINVSWWSSNVGFRIHYCPTKKQRFLFDEGVCVFVITNLFLAWVVSATIRSISARFPDIFSNSICLPLWPGKGYQVAIFYNIFPKKTSILSNLMVLTFSCYYLSPCIFSLLFLTHSLRPSCLLSINVRQDNLTWNVITTAAR